VSTGLYALIMTFKSDASNPSSRVTLLEMYLVLMFPPDGLSSPVTIAVAPEVPESSGGDNWFVEHKEGGLEMRLIHQVVSQSDNVSSTVE